MSDIICYDSNGNTITEFQQGSVDNTVKISGLNISPLPEVHLCNRLSETALVVTPTLSGGSLLVDIPDELLQRAEVITAYIYQKTDKDNDSAYDGARTVHSIRFHVRPRSKSVNCI